jgi:hypothetical protein
MTGCVGRRKLPHSHKNVPAERKCSWCGWTIPPGETFYVVAGVGIVCSPCYESDNPAELFEAGKVNNENSNNH